MRLTASALLLCAACLAAQTTGSAPDNPTLEFTGSPLTVPFPCNGEDLEWAGLACTETDCPIYLELTHAAGQGSTILVSGDFHSSAVTMDSVLLRSADGGHTWREPFERIRGAALDAIQMFDAQTGWVSGEIMQPLAMDPFLLHSTDGGRSWQRIPLFAEEGTPGAVAQFAFDSRDHGRVVIAQAGGERRYQIYETHTAGAEWSLASESDDLPKLKNVEDPDWRVRPEPKLFRLEHIEDGRWTPFASFALGSTACREIPAATPTPPTQ